MKIQLLTLTVAALSIMANANVPAEYPSYSAKEAADVSKPVAMESAPAQKHLPTQEEAKAADEELAKLKQHLQSLGEPTPEEKAQMETEGMEGAEESKEEAVESMAMPSEPTKETAMMPEPDAMPSEPEEMETEVEEPTMGADEPMEAEQPAMPMEESKKAMPMQGKEMKGMEMPVKEEEIKTEEMPSEKPSEM